MRKNLGLLLVLGVIAWLVLRKKDSPAAPQVKITLTDLSDADLLSIDDNGIATGGVVTSEATP